MFFESQGAEQHRDDAQMHHFLDTNLFRARPRVRKWFGLIFSNEMDIWILGANSYAQSR